MSKFETIANVGGTNEENGSVFNKIANVEQNPNQGIFGKFFEPDKGGKVRLRDLVREYPDAARRVTTGVGDLTASFLRDSARVTGGAGLTLMNAINKGLGTGNTISEFKVQDDATKFEKIFAKILYGDEAFEALGTRTEKLPERTDELVQKIGFEEQYLVNKYTAPFLVVGEVALELTPGGGKAKNAVMNFLSKSDKVDDIVDFIKTNVKGFNKLKPKQVQEVAEQIAKTTDRNAINSIMDFALNPKTAREAREIVHIDMLFELEKTRDLLDKYPPVGRSLDLRAMNKVDDWLARLKKGENFTTAERADVFEFLAMKNASFRQNERVIKALNLSKNRKFAETIRKAPVTKPVLKAAMNMKYNPLSNKEVMIAAQDLINRNYDEALRLATDRNSFPGALDNAVGQLILVEKQNAGKWEEAFQIAEVLAERGNKAGQAIQTLSMYNRFSPEGILRFAAREVRKYNKAAQPGKKIKVPKQFPRELSDMAKKIELMEDGEDKAVATALMLNKINELFPSSWAKKLATAQTIAQLLNPKTILRNVVGNTAFAGIENVKDVVAVAIDSPLSLITKQRTKTLPSISVQLKGAAEGLRQGIRDAMLGIDTAGIRSQFDLPNSGVFKGKVGQLLERSLSVVLRGPDRAMFKAAYDGSLYQQIKAHYLTTGEILDTPTDAMIEIATHEGLYRTFQDDNLISLMFSRLKRALNTVGYDGFGLGEFTLKFPKTPGALIARGLDYSPMGFTYAMFEATRPLMGVHIKKTFKTAERFVDLSSNADHVRSFKTFDDFLDSKSIFRGQGAEFKEIQKVNQTNAIDNILFGRGTFTTTSRDVAETYGPNLFRFRKPTRTEEVFDLTNLSDDTLKKVMPDSFFKEERLGGIIHRPDDVMVSAYNTYKRSLKNGDLKDAEDIIVEQLAEKYLPKNVTWNQVKAGTPELVDRGVTADVIRDKMVNDLKSFGYKWFKHRGGVRVGGKGEHDVYVALTDDALKPLNNKQLKKIYEQSFLKETFETDVPLKKELEFGDFDQRAFVESFSRALVGSTGLIGMGALMHRLGLITGDPNPDPDINAVQRMTGLGGFRINVSAMKRFVLSGFDPEAIKLEEGDVQYTYDWFQPMAIGVSIGANIDENAQQNASTGETAVGIGTALLEGVVSGIDTVGEQPLIKNLTRIFRAGDLSGATTEVIKQIPRSFIPTLLNQINQYVDNRSRNVYDPSFIHESFNAAKQRMPGTAQTLLQRVDVFGNDAEVYQDESNTLFNVFFNPGFKSVYKPTPEAELVLDLYDQTGETKQAPRLTKKKIEVNGEMITLGPKQRTAMQTFVGSMTRTYFSTLNRDPNFQRMSPEDKVNHMSSVLTDIGVAGKFIILGDRPQPGDRNLSRRAQQIIASYFAVGNEGLRNRVSDIQNF